jgi:hypothetical protein
MECDLMKTRNDALVKTFSGAVAGAAATLPMTVAMLAIRRFLPATQRGSIDPHTVTSRVLQRMHLADPHTAQRQTAATTLGHIGYGAATGALFATAQRLLPLPPMVRGLLFGLGVWGTSYAGWLPATGILPPPDKRPRGRNLMMVAAHLVWGAVLGLGYRYIVGAIKSKPSSNASPARRRTTSSNPRTTQRSPRRPSTSTSSRSRVTASKR